MQKFLKSILFAIIFAFYPACAFASGGITISAPNLTIEVGGISTFTITATNTIGDVSISSSDPGIAQVDVGEWGTGMIEEGQTKSGTVTVTGVHEGSAVVTLTLDAATFDGEDLAGQTLTVAVNVVAQQSPPAQEPQQSQQPTSSPSSPQPAPSDNAPSTPTPAPASTDDASEELSADDHKSQKNDDSHYAGSQNLSSTTKSDTTADSSDVTDKSSGGFPIILIIIGAAVLAAAGVAVFFILKKRSFR